MKWLDLIFAARPLLHLPVWSLYLVSLHYHLELSGETILWRDLLVMLGLNLLTAGAYYINQVHDREGDALNRKLGFLSGGILSERLLMGAYVAVTTLALALGAAASWQLLFVYAQLAVLGYLYSAPPFRLKDRPFWGLFANAYAFGILVPLAVMPDFSEHTAGLLGWDNPFYLFLAVGAVYLMTTLPDRDGDLASGKRTLAVVWPRWAVIGLASVMLAGAAMVGLRSGYEALVVVALLSLVPVAGALVVRAAWWERMAAKVPILLFTLLAGWFAPGYLVFVLVLVATVRIYYRRRFGIVYPQLA